MIPNPAAIVQRAAAMASRRPDRVTWLLIALSLLGAGLVLARTSFWGVGLGSDAITYIATARNLLEGEGFVHLYENINRLYVWWPPLYPALLAAAGFGVFDPHNVAAPLNAVIFGLTVFGVGQYLRRRLKSRFLFWWVCAVLALSLPLIWMASFALTGALFVLMATLALIQCDEYLEHGKTSALIWAAVFSALAWQTRYLGVAVPALIGLMLLFQPGAAMPQRVKRIALYSLIVAAPMGLWLLRNYLLVGELTGGQADVDYSPADVWSDMAMIIRAGWENIYVPLLELFPAGSTLGRMVWVIAGLAAIIIAPLIYIFINGLWRSRNCAQRRPVIIFGGFALLYFMALVAGAMSGSSWNGIEARYVIPLYLPFLVAAALVLDQFLSYAMSGNPAESIGRWPIIRAYARFRIRGIPLPPLMLMAALCFCVVALLAANALDFRRVASDGISDTTNSRWVNSDTMRYIRENLTLNQIHSNEPNLVYIYTAGDAAAYWHLPAIIDLQPLRNVEGNYGDNFASGRERLRYWLKDVPEGTYVIWFLDWYANAYYDFGDAEMRELPELELTAELDDGVIFRVARGTPPP